MLIGRFIIKKTLPNLSKTPFLQPAHSGMEMLHLSAVALGASWGQGLQQDHGWGEEKHFGTKFLNLLLLPCLELSVQLSIPGSPRGDDRGDSAALAGSPARAVLVVQAISERLMTFLWTELHCYSRVQRHWHHHSINSQWHQPSGKEEDGPRVGAEGKWMLCVKHINTEIKHNFIVGIMWVFVKSQYS